MGNGAADALLLLTGQTGATVFADTSAHTGTWRRLTVLTTAAVTMILDDVLLAAITIPAGTDVFGKITSVTLGSGVVVVYK